MSEFESAVTAFLLIKTNRAWLDLPVPERAAAFRENVLPAIEDKAKDVRWRYYDTEFYSARVTDIWVWEARDHDTFQLVIEALRETPFWDHYFEIVEIIVGVENAVTKNYGPEILATVDA
ncbi:darcynin family protein [Lentzea sp. HUAS12]|uniref:darcynin family protein n=1 Tax=Lentzea sp. HUAS12 TaxID=2951806 RepID=UPI00209C9C32|nr:darcynin family protein [Lentzea sp. HUAS12]USX49974.1 darcynin [Lentzea sp. HUAS12]